MDGGVEPVCAAQLTCQAMVFSPLLSRLRSRGVGPGGREGTGAPGARSALLAETNDNKQRDAVSLIGRLSSCDQRARIITHPPTSN